MDYVQPSLSGLVRHDDVSSATQSQVPGATANSAQQSAASNKLQRIPVGTALQQHSKQLDDKLVAGKQDNMNRMQARFAEHNTKVKYVSRDSLP